jgi:hypothetical protein
MFIRAYNGPWILHETISSELLKFVEQMGLIELIPSSRGKLH